MLGEAEQRLEGGGERGGLCRLGWEGGELGARESHVQLDELLEGSVGLGSGPGLGLWFRVRVRVRVRERVRTRLLEGGVVLLLCRGAEATHQLRRQRQHGGSHLARGARGWAVAGRWQGGGRAVAGRWQDGAL